MKSLNVIIVTSITGLLFATSALAQSQQLNTGVKLPQDIGVQDNSQFRDYVKKHGLQLKLPPVAKPRSASLSVYSVPFNTWCENNPGGSTQGRVTVNMNYPRTADGTTVPAVLVVHIGSRRDRTNVSLGAGLFTVTSDTFSVPGSEICTDRCLNYHLEARNSADAAKVDSRRRQACIH